MSKQTYGNGDFVEFSYDNLDRQTQTRYNGDNSLRITYSYGNNGSVAQITDGEEEISYAYNGDGQRVSKTVNGTTTEYIYNGDILAGQKTGNDVLVFMYDNNGDPFGFICNGTEYYYIKNAQNDVTAIASADGTILANYYYDPWGKLIETTGDTEIAELNPIRYRSYYYDSETEWYYLNTRYYSPDLCRFISSDGYIQTGQGLLDKNMFVYCLNNPINMLDQTGEIAGWAIALIVIGICTIAGGVIGGLRATNAYNTAYTNSRNNNSNSRNNHSNSQNNKRTNSNKGNSNNSNSKKSSSKNTKSYSNTQSRSKSTYEYEEKLKPQEIAMNVFIGATMGLAVGGALVMSGGALIAVMGNMVAAGGAATLFGASTLTVISGAQQATAIGMLAFNLEAMVFGPFYFAELEPIEWKAE